MSEKFIRSEMLFGADSIENLSKKSVVVFGVGGVGGYVVEALARAGVGNITVVDNDTVDISNINRQIIALESTIGKNKVDVIKQRILDINPNCNVTTVKMFYLPDNSNQFDLSIYDYIVDAIDTVSAKLELIKNAENLGVKIISSMGTGNKICPEKFKICDIFETSGDPLARVMRTELRKRNIKKLKVVFSPEEPKNASTDAQNKRIPASCSFVPPVAGFFIAGEVIKELLRG